MDNSSESPGKASNFMPQQQSGCGGSRISRSKNQRLAAYPEISVGELVNPKSTLKHLFGTGKDSRVSLNREVLFKYIDLAGVGCRRNHRECKNFCGRYVCRLTTIALRIEIYRFR
jgi:hypothetical protein